MKDNNSTTFEHPSGFVPSFVPVAKRSNHSQLLKALLNKVLLFFTKVLQLVLLFLEKSLTIVGYLVLTSLALVGCAFMLFDTKHFSNTKNTATS